MALGFVFRLPKILFGEADSTNCSYAQFGEWLMERVDMSKKILISDDATFMRAQLRGILIENQFAVYEATNGQEAIEKYEAYNPDLVFMDIIMPVMDGIAATKAIRANHPDAVIVMCTSMGQQSMIIESVKAGAKDFIVKPFQPQRVLDCIKKLVA